MSDDKATMLVLDRVSFPKLTDAFNTILIQIGNAESAVKRLNQKIDRQICMSCETDFQDPDRSRFYTGYGAYCDCCYESFLRSK